MKKKRGIEKMLEICHLFMGLYAKAPPLLEVETFIMVAQNDGLLSQTELTERMRKHCTTLNDGHVSRYLYSLGSGKRNQTTKEVEPGRNLIVTKPDPQNYARNLVHLTTYGQEIADKLQQILEG